MKKFLKKLDKIEDFVAPFFLIIMCIAVFAQIIGRVVVKKPLLYTEEIARYSYIWCVYFLISMGEKYQDHFAVDIFVRFLKGRADTALYVIEKAIGCVMFAFLFVWSISFFKFQKVIVSPAFGISVGFVAISMCIGFLLSFIRRGTHLVNYVKILLEPTVLASEVTERKED